MHTQHETSPVLLSFLSLSSHRRLFLLILSHPHIPFSILPVYAYLCRLFSAPTTLRLPVHFTRLYSYKHLPPSRHSHHRKTTIIIIIVMQSQGDIRQYQYTPRTHVRERPLHWLIIVLSLVFIFLLVIESVAFVVLGAWHLTIPRLRSIQSFSDDIYRRELGFGILLVIVGSVGVMISVLGLVAFFSLRLILLRLVSERTFKRRKTMTML